MRFEIITLVLMKGTDLDKCVLSWIELIDWLNSFYCNNISNFIFQCSKFNVTIRLLNGQEFDIEMTPNETVANLKCKIQEASSIPMDEQTLLCKGNELDDTYSLSRSGINDYCIICLILKLKLVSYLKINFLNSSDFIKF